MNKKKDLTLSKLFYKLACIYELQASVKDETVKQKMGKASLDMLNKLKSGIKTTIQKLKDEGSASQKFNKDNFDLITWFIISK